MSEKHDVARETQCFKEIVPVQEGKPHAGRKGLRMRVQSVEVVDGYIRCLHVEWTQYRRYSAGCIYVDPHYPLQYDPAESLRDDNNE